MPDLGSSSSSGSYHYVERVIDISDAGVLREFDLDDQREERPLVAWQYPVRVLDDGRSLAIVNRDEMVARRDRFMAEADIPMSACGSYYFTWNVFQVECDPEAVLELYEELDLQPDSLAEGSPVLHSSTDEQGTLERAGRRSLRAELPVSPELVRRERAEGDMVIAALSGEELTVEEALAARADDRVSGTVEILLEYGPDRMVHTRTETVRITYTDGDETENMESVRTYSRRSSR